MGKIKVNETASEPIDMKKSGSDKEIFGASGAGALDEKNVKNPAKAGGAAVKSATVKTGVGARKKALALPAGSIGAAVIDEKEKAANGIEGKTGGAKAVVGEGAKAGNAKVAGAVAGAAGVKKTSNLTMDGMVKPKARTLEVTEIETTAEEEFEAHRPKEKKIEDEPEVEENPRFSKPKAALIGVGVALVVAVIGGVLIGLFSHKEAPRCIVQFESNGGSKIESEEVVCGETVGRPDDPTKEGFAFQNWIYGGAPFDFDGTTIDEDMILVAKWQVEEGVETVTVRFDTAGGSEVEDIEVKKGGVILEPVEPTRTSYEFAGWKLNGEDFDFSKPIEEDMTLVAEWKPVAGGNGDSTSGSGSGSGNNKPVEKPNVESLAVNEVSMKIGGTNMIDITITPKDAKYQLGVSSDNPGVAVCSVVDGNRLKCEGKSAGEATIILRDSLSGKSTQFKVKVAGEVTFVKLNKNALALTEGLSEKLIATVTGDGDKTVTWSSNNPSVATVDASGRVTAVKEGTAVITATVGGKAATCTVTVSARYVPPVDPPEEKPDPDPEPENPGDGGNTDGS